MTILTNPASTLNPIFKKSHNYRSTNSHCLPLPKIQASNSSNQQQDEPQNLNHQRRSVLKAIVTSCSVVLGLQNGNPQAMAQSWGTRSMLWERFFGQKLSPEESVARLRLTAEGFHTLREMLEHFSWRYVLTFIRAKKPYLSQDMQNAMELVPQERRQSYIDTANDLVDNISQLDSYVRTPKIYESYLYYEKTLKSIDDLVAFLA